MESEAQPPASVGTISVHPERQALGLFVGQLFAGHARVVRALRPDARAFDGLDARLVPPGQSGELPQSARSEFGLTTLRIPVP